MKFIFTLFLTSVCFAAQIDKNGIKNGAVDETKILLNNAGYLQAENASSSGTVNMCRVNSSNQIEFASLPVVGGSSLATQAYVGSNAITPSAFSAKGDILIGTGASTFTNFSACPDGQSLQYDSTQTAGVKCASSGGGTISGSGTTGFIPKFTSSSAIGNSILFTSGTTAAINTSSPQTAAAIALDIRGDSVLYTPATGSFDEGMNVVVPSGSGHFCGYALHVGAAGAAPSASTEKSYWKLDPSNNNVVLGGFDGSNDYRFVTIDINNGNYWVAAVTGNVGIRNTSPNDLLDIGTAGSTGGVIRFEGSSSGFTRIKPAAAAGSWTLTLPASAGSSGQLVQTDGTGVYSYATITSLNSASSTLGNGATQTLAVSGLLSSDTILAVTQVTAGSTSQPLIQWANQTSGTLDLTWPADPGNGATVKVLVRR